MFHVFWLYRFKALYGNYLQEAFIGAILNWLFSSMRSGCIFGHSIVESIAFVTRVKRYIMKDFTGLQNSGKWISTVWRKYVKVTNTNA